MGGTTEKRNKYKISKEAATCDRLDVGDRLMLIWFLDECAKV
jgi:hypothetical protein